MGLSGIGLSGIGPFWPMTDSWIIHPAGFRVTAQRQLFDGGRGGGNQYRWSAQDQQQQQQQQQQQPRAATNNTLSAADIVYGLNYGHKKINIHCINQSIFE